MKKIIILVFAIFISHVNFAQIKTTYQYDTESRLVNTKDDTKTQTYQYDKLGNRLGYKLTSSVSLPDLSISFVDGTSNTFTQGQETAVTATISLSLIHI